MTEIAGPAAIVTGGGSGLGAAAVRRRLPRATRAW
jgi:NAD(P)-dependent dehydrogenase (short-subunit alcohol dehydrogenase family)